MTPDEITEATANYEEIPVNSGGSRIHAYLGGYGDPYQVDFWAIADQGATDAG